MEAERSPRNANIDEDPVGGATASNQYLRYWAFVLIPAPPIMFTDFPCAGGGACDIYRGVLDDGTEIAIKTLRIYGDKEKVRILKSAARELCHWSKLQHRNVLPLLGLTIFREHISLVSGWMENGSLVSYLKRRPDVNRIKLCMDICAGLCYIHTVDMVHGDLKAANVMISSDGTALIADFGNAELRDLTLKFTNSSKLDLSLRWAAPELLVPACPQVSKEADVYAFGMTVLEVLTGKLPFYGTNEYLIPCLVVRKGKVPPRPDIGIRDDLWNLLNWCWTREPTERPEIASVKGLLQALFQPPFDTWSIKDTISQSQGNEFNSMQRENAEGAVPRTHVGPPETARKLAEEGDGGGGGALTERFVQVNFSNQNGQEDSGTEEESGEEEDSSVNSAPSAPPTPQSDSPPAAAAPPQRRRGKLPKHVTETLRTWILSHADHPYPTEEEKKQLCNVTGLTLSQVSNWMINARRRILVPASKQQAALNATTGA